MAKVDVSGGAAAEKALKEISDRLGDGGTLAVGFLENATYPDGTQVALVAAVQNWGAPSRGIPPRPFFTEMVAENSPAWGRQLAAILKSTNYDVDRSLNLMGEVIRGELQEKITTFEGVPLAQATIDRKGHDKQLIDTAHMLHSVDYNVKRGQP